MTTQQPEALRLTEMLTANEWPGHVTIVSYARECVAELRRQHARIAELEAQLEAIGAGGVSGPLMGRASLSANAVEPVAWQYRSLRDNGAWFDCTKERFEMRCTQPEIWETRALYAAPPTTQAEGWVSVDERLPAKNTEVLICFAESPLPSTGQYTGHAADPAGWCYPNESYLLPGESEKLPDGGDPTVTHWMPLPPLPTSAEGGEHG